jgi:hypothetical protein
MDFTLKAGLLMVREGLVLPSPVSLTSDTYSKNWRVVKSHDGFSLERAIRATGWSFMFFAASSHASFWGAETAKSKRRAMQHILDIAEAGNFNSVEVTEINQRSFLGISYTAISAHPRHVQECNVLQTLTERQHAQENAGSAHPQAIS